MKALTLKPQEAAYMLSACLYRFAYVLNLSLSVSGEINTFVWQRGHKTWQDSQHLKTKKAISGRAYWYSVLLLCHCSFSCHNPRNELLFQPRCSISPQGHWKTQYNYLRQKHGSKQKLVRIITKCPQDIKSRGKLPFWDYNLFTHRKLIQEQLCIFSHKLLTWVNKDSWELLQSKIWYLYVCNSSVR